MHHPLPAAATGATSRAAARRVALAAALLAGLGAAAAIAQAPAPPAAPLPEDDAVVAARVDGADLTVGEVRRLWKLSAGGRPPSGQEAALLAAQALDEAIARRLLSAYFAELGLRPSDDDVAQARAKLVTQLAARNLPLEKFLEQQGLVTADLDAQLAWESVWNGWLKTRLTDEALAAAFEARRREFDGTRLRVRHVLLRVPAPGDAAQVAATVARARDLRQRIAAGEFDLADAARRYSDGPSREQGGDLGFIGRREPMVEPFSAAAFALKPGQVSEPVWTPFGVHLIEVTEVQPGKKTWQDVRADLVPAVARDLRAEVLAERRAKARIEYTGRAPYLEPQTGRLVVP